MESKLELLCHSAGLSYNKFIRLNKADAKQATVSQVLKPARYNLPFIILLYLITVLGLILPYHGILAGMEYSRALALLLAITCHRISEGRI
jgi:hypothetical protein